MYAVETRDLTKFYGKSRGIIDISLAIGRGEIFGFIGPNGAGKSTTIRVLLNLVYAQKGHGKILGMDIVAQAKEIKRHIGYIPAEVDYYHAMTVLEFLRYSGKFYGIDSEARLQELADYFQVDLKRRILDLSLGNKKKVSIIQSLLHKPKLLILDEPTSGLDPLMQARFFDLLQHENEKGTTIFFSSHILSEVQKLCRRVAIIREGRVIALEDIHTLRKKQLKRVNIECAADMRPTISSVPGVSGLVQAGNDYAFTFTGEIKHLLAALQGADLENLSIEESSLEEIFMHYYSCLAEET